LFTYRNWTIVEVVRRIAGDIGRRSAQVALAWVIGRFGVTSTLMGVSRPEQVTDTLLARDLELAPAHRAARDEVSARDARMLYALVTPAPRRDAVFGGDPVRGWR
jgi:aryl-alcohol dehydrogenase-like predicted oxidoreductase